MATPPDFTAGQVLTAAQMNAVGLWLVKSQTIGTTVSSVTVADAFSADYDNYRIIVSGGVASTTLTLLLTLGATTTGYYGGGFFVNYASGTSTSFNNNNTTSINNAGAGSAQSLNMDMDLNGPFLSKQTHFRTSYSVAVTNQNFLFYGGFVNDTTSYTGFTITTSSGTITGGKIDVYGYRN